MAVYGKISNFPPSGDTPTDDDTPPSSGNRKAEMSNIESTPAKSNSTISKHASAAGLGTTSLLANKDDFLFSVANSPTRKREFDINEFNM